MRFTSISAVLAMAVSAFAQTADFNPVYTPESGATIEAGSTFEITWDAPAKYSEGTISIHLIGGATQNTQVPLLDIASGIPNSAEKYSWAVGSTLGDQAVYGLVLRYESSPDIFQYSNPFHIKAGSGEVEPTASTSATATGSDGTATTVTTNVGAVTVTISSCTTSTTAEAVTSVHYNSTTSSVHYTAPPVNYNSTTFTTATPVKPTVVTSVAVVEPTPTAIPAPSVTPPPASGAAGLSASLALVAGLAMAVLAL